MLLITTQTKDFELLDSGDGEKLERYGAVRVSRPDPQALWRKRLPVAEWKRADAQFARDARRAEWHLGERARGAWQIELGGLQFLIKPTSFKHVGIFPEQLSNWKWIVETIAGAQRSVRVLNLFAYTGGATCAAAHAGAQVTHVDGSKVACAWARENAARSGLAHKPIRWIMEDARAFVKREIRRGARYDGVILDPPAFGHGPKKELWKIENDFVPLLELCRAVMSEHPLFFLINGYASGYSALAYENNIRDLMHPHGGTSESGEVGIAEAPIATHLARTLPAGIFARWHV